MFLVDVVEFVCQFRTTIFVQLREISFKFNERLIGSYVHQYTGETVACEHTWKMRINYFTSSMLIVLVQRTSCRFYTFVHKISMFFPHLYLNVS